MVDLIKTQVQSGMESIEMMELVCQFGKERVGLLLKNNSRFLTSNTHEQDQRRPTISLNSILHKQSLDYLLIRSF